MRQLQQQAGQAQATVVTTAQQLIDAIEGGALDIEIREHLDLTPLAPRDTEERPQMLSDDSRATQDFGRSIRVRNSLLMLTSGCMMHEATPWQKTECAFAHTTSTRIYHVLSCTGHLSCSEPVCYVQRSSILRNWKDDHCSMQMQGAVVFPY